MAEKHGKSTLYPITLDAPIRQLPVKLKDKELTAKTRDFIASLQELKREEQSQENEKKVMKARLAAIQERLDLLGVIVDTGEEYRSVQVELRLLENGQVEEIRKDTGEIITTREIKDTERQLVAKGMEKTGA